MCIKLQQSQAKSPILLHSYLKVDLFSFCALQMWQDELLTWNPTDYNNTTTLTVEGKEIWLPEISLFNR